MAKIDDPIGQIKAGTNEPPKNPGTELAARMVSWIPRSRLVPRELPLRFLEAARQSGFMLNGLCHAHTLVETARLTELSGLLSRFGQRYFDSAANNGESNQRAKILQQQR
jgi:hypothetical protein